jgi:2-keto-4-pentenoate hydratase/2-oxohepta-3-ene-1,7-dioic acid hydratase in catechol pathway
VRIPLDRDGHEGEGVKLSTFEIATPLGRVRRIGVETAMGVLDATVARAAFLAKSLPLDAAKRVGAAQVPVDMVKFIGMGQQGFEWLTEAIADVTQRGQTVLADQRLTFDHSEVTLLAPVPRPAGLTNFSAWPQHIKNASDQGVNLRNLDSILTYWKGNADSFIGTGADLERPSYATELDVECELAAVIGRAHKDMSLDEAELSIAGYTILNDVSVRDVQIEEMKSGRGPAKGKDFDGGNVLGPWIVTPDEIGDVRTLHMSLHLNEQELSSATGSQMSPSFPTLIAYLSKGQSLRPGHVVTSGCFHGGSGYDLGIKFAPGDLIEMRISRIGSLINRIAI